MKAFSPGGWAVRVLLFLAIAVVALLFQADRQARITSTDSPWNAKAEEMGFPAEAPKSTKSKTEEQ